MHPPGSVIWLRDTQGLFPIFTFGGDTDPLNEGWTSLTSTNRREIVLAKATAMEFNRGERGITETRKRAEEQLRRSDLREVHLLRVEEANPPRGTSFQAFRSAYSQRKTFYSSLEGPGEATVESIQTTQEFVAAGGAIHTVSEGQL
jgi:hypothetical protein